MSREQTSHKAPIFEVYIQEEVWTDESMALVSAHLCLCVALLVHAAAREFHSLKQSHIKQDCACAYINPPVHPLALHHKQSKPNIIKKCPQHQTNLAAEYAAKQGCQSYCCNQTVYECNFVGVGQQSTVSWCLRFHVRFKQMADQADRQIRGLKVRP